MNRKTLYTRTYNIYKDKNRIDGLVTEIRTWSKEEGIKDWYYMYKKV